MQVIFQENHENCIYIHGGHLGFVDNPPYWIKIIQKCFRGHLVNIISCYATSEQSKMRFHKSHEKFTAAILERPPRKNWPHFRPKTKLKLFLRVLAKFWYQYHEGPPKCTRHPSMRTPDYYQKCTVTAVARCLGECASELR